MKLRWLVMCAALVGCGDDTTGDAPPVITSALDLATMEDTPGSLPVAAYDPDGVAVTIAISTEPMHGSATLANDRLTYTPAANYNGADSIGITVSDGTMSTSGTISIAISAVNDPPVGTADAYSTDEDTPLVVGAAALLANDTDPDGDSLTITGVGHAVGGTVGFVGGSVTFTPFSNSSGAASFTYTLSDGTLQVDVPVSVNVGATNDPPVAVDDSVTTPEEIPVMIAAATLAANDTDADGQTPMVIAVSNATGGTAVLASNFVTFSPALNFNGAGGFDYTISDGSATDVGHVTVTVTPVEDRPVAVDDVATTPIGTPLIIPATTLLANDTDPDPGATQMLTAVQAPQHGTVSLAGTTVTFTPAAGFVGAASFDYVLSDGMLTDVGTVAVTVTPICGDGVVSTGEPCDDGNPANGDGCSMTCAVETGWTCAGQPSLCTAICGDALVRGTEPCDDGNQDNTDGCDTQCRPAVVCNATVLPGADHFSVLAGPGTCYAEWDDDPTTFAAAEASCIAAGGHLATITTSAQQAAAGAAHAPAQTPYIGATDDGNDTDAVFAWVTSEAWSYTNFTPGQPDDAPAGDGECLALSGAASTWDDVSCTAAGAASGRICQIELDACGDHVVQPVRDEECDDGAHTLGDGCDATCKLETLYISKYVEGSSNNKVIEIASPFTAPYDLAAHACALKSYANGSAISTNTLALTGTIAVGDVFVACNTNVTAAVAAQCDVLNNGVMQFNGDDALTLECGGSVVDSVGQVGADPGTEWGTGLTSTADNTLVHRCAAGSRGDRNPADAYDPAVMFAGFPTDTFDSIGTATCAP